MTVEWSRSCLRSQDEFLAWLYDALGIIMFELPDPVWVAFRAELLLRLDIEDDLALGRDSATIALLTTLRSSLETGTAGTPGRNASGSDEPGST